MQITLMQGILLAIMTIIVGLDFFLEAFFVFRPLMVSTFTGIILGDVVLGLKVAGGILPAVGFGMLLRVMMKAKYTPYFIAGFLMASFCDMPNLLPVALLGTVFALIDFFGAKQRKQDIEEALQNASIDSFGGDDNVGI